MLGDVSSLIGMLGINIVTINGVDNARRGLLLMCDNQEQISRLESILNTMDNITVTKYRPPKLRDKLAVDMVGTYNEMQMIRRHFGLCVMN